jgi:cytochrome d ubiquinol oxidase subunit II
MGFAIWTGVISGRGVGPNIFGAVAVVAVVVAATLAGTQREGWTFAAACVAMGATIATIFAHLYSNVMVSSTNSAFNVTIGNASSSSYALTVMTVVACIFAPLVLAYQGWSYHVFRGRLAAPRTEVQLGGLDTSRQADRRPSPQRAPEAP